MDTQVVGLEDRRVELAVEMLKLLADETRLRIVWVLLHGEHAVNELADHVGVRPAAVSQHLAKLRLARVVTTRRDGNRILYSTENMHIHQLAEQALFHTGHLVGSAHPERGPNVEATPQKRSSA